MQPLAAAHARQAAHRSQSGGVTHVGSDGSDAASCGESELITGPWDFADSWLVAEDLLRSKNPNEIIHGY